MTSGVHPFLNSPKGKVRRLLGVFICARVCAPAVLHTRVPCCDFTVGLVPIPAGFTLLVSLIGVSAGGVKGEMPWGGGGDSWFLVSWW